MFTKVELNRLLIAMQEKIMDDYYTIDFWEQELNKYKNTSDIKYLKESKNNLKIDEILIEKIKNIIKIKDKFY